MALSVKARQNEGVELGWVSAPSILFLAAKHDLKPRLTIRRTFSRPKTAGYAWPTRLTVVSQEKRF